MTIYTNPYHALLRAIELEVGQTFDASRENLDILAEAMGSINNNLNK